MGEASLGFGIQFKRGNGADPQVFTTIGNLVDVTPPTKTRETKDATHHGVANRIRKVIAGLRDLGEATIVLHFDPGGTAEDDLNDDFMSDVPVDYKIVYPNAEEDPFTAFVTELSPATPLDDVMKISAKLKLTGA